MEKAVIISIRGMQCFEDTGDDAIELVTEGQLKRQEGGFLLSYAESELTGLNGTTTTLEIEEDKVTLMRMGEFNSQMVFEEGKRHLSLYETPYGALSVGVNTKRMDCRMGESGGDIEIDYAIEIDHAVAGENLFRIHVREQKRPLLKQ
ncbi:MAG: DUF1934 domain-containing protein [Oscillospiraceae bacterium]|nr:DUF1934 domain-containing protein [Oscillospiraceae bacterium]